MAHVAIGLDMIATCIKKPGKAIAVNRLDAWPRLIGLGLVDCPLDIY